MLKTQANPEGNALEVFDGFRKGTAGDPLAILQGPDNAVLRFNARREGPMTLRDRFGCKDAGGIRGNYDCIREFSEVDYTDDLRKIDKPTPIITRDTSSFRSSLMPTRPRKSQGRAAEGLFQAPRTVWPRQRPTSSMPRYGLHQGVSGPAKSE